MQVTPVNPPVQNSSENKAPSARDRAINAYVNPKGNEPQNAQVQQLPVSDPSKVTVQELAGLNSSGISSDESETQTATPEVKSVAKPEEAISPQYAALARREKALRARAMQQDQAFKAREEALKAREEALKPPSQTSFDSSKYVSIEDLQKDPYGQLARANLTYDQLVEQAMNAPKPEEVRLQQLEAKYEAKIKALEDKLDGTNKSIKDQEDNAYKGAINQIRYDVTKIVNSDPSFDTIKVTGQTEEVVKLIESVYKDGMGNDYPKGSVLDVYEAAKMIEEEIAENLYNWSSKAQKVKSRFQPQSAATSAQSPAQKSSTSQTSSNPQMKTLTNQMNASRQLSARERAILAAQGKLK